MVTTAPNLSHKTASDAGAILFESPQRPRAGSLGTSSTTLAGPSGALGFTGELAADLFEALTLTRFQRLRLGAAK